GYPPECSQSWDFVYLFGRRRRAQGKGCNQERRYSQKLRCTAVPHRGGIRTPGGSLVTTANDPWGRVDTDGTVYVRTADGERVIGSWAAGSPEEALEFFRRKFQSLETEVALLEQRLASTDLAPGQAQAAVRKLLAAVSGASALGDLDSLTA